VVGNAAQTASCYQLVYGMELIAYAGPETGQRDVHSYVDSATLRKPPASTAAQPPR